MLSIEHLSVDYERRGRVIPAVRDFSLTINRGETVGLVGESGSGKSTVALAILRLIRPQEGRITGGQIRFDGKDLLSLPNEDMRRVRGRNIAMIFQDPFTSLNPVLTIRRQMEEVLSAHPDGAPHAAIGESLAKVQLEPDRTLNAYPHQLSGGQRQRVMIAMAILNQPDLILADEPTTALDVLVQREVLDLLFKLQLESKCGMLFISHNLGLVSMYTSRVAVIKEGTLVEESSPSDLFAHPKTEYAKGLISSIRFLET